MAAALALNEQLEARVAQLQEAVGRLRAERDAQEAAAAAAQAQAQILGEAEAAAAASATEQAAALAVAQRELEGARAQLAARPAKQRSSQEAMAAKISSLEAVAAAVNGQLERLMARAAAGGGWRRLAVAGGGGCRETARALRCMLNPLQPALPPQCRE